MNQFDYFYGNEVEQFSFFRIPKLLITEPVFSKLSDSAKIMYGLFLDRVSLSRKNNWLDDQNRAYVIFSVEEIMDTLNCGNQKVAKVLAELDSKKGIGLMERVRRGFGKPDIIYVKNFSSVLSEVDLAKTIPSKNNGKRDTEDIQTPENRAFEEKCENHISRDVKTTSLFTSNTELNKTDSNKTEKRERTEALSREEDIIEMTKEEREMFDLFIEERKAAGKHTTRVQRNLLIQNLFLCGNTESERLEILEKTIQKGWLDFYPPDNGSPKAN